MPSKNSKKRSRAQKKKSHAGRKRQKIPPQSNQFNLHNVNPSQWAMDKARGRANHYKMIVGEDIPKGMKYEIGMRVFAKGCSEDDRLCGIIVNITNESLYTLKLYPTHTFNMRNCSEVELSEVLTEADREYFRSVELQPDPKEKSFEEFCSQGIITRARRLADHDEHLQKLINNNKTGNPLLKEELKRLGDHNSKGYIESGTKRPKPQLPLVEEPSHEVEPEPVIDDHFPAYCSEYECQDGGISQDEYQDGRISEDEFQDGRISEDEFQDGGLSDNEDEFQDGGLSDVEDEFQDGGLSDHEEEYENDPGVINDPGYKKACEQGSNSSCDELVKSDHECEVVAV